MTNEVAALPDNAKVSRTHNLQFFELVPPIHPPGNAYLSRTENLQFFEMTSSFHPPGDAYASRTRNLQGFEMTPLLYQYKIEIIEVDITDEYGNPANKFAKGETIQIKFVIMNLGDAESLPLNQGLVCLEVLDQLSTVMFLGYTFVDLPKQSSKEFVFGFTIPPTAMDGIYTIKIMVYTDWPMKGGIGLTIEEAEFIVA